MQYEKIMGIDFGDVRIGVAFSDLTGTLASAYETYKRVSFQKDLAHLAALIQEKDVKSVVLGLPVNMDGSEGVRVEKTKIFAEALKNKAGVNICFQDERLSSVEAEEKLIAMGVKREKRKDLIDQVAAAIILQNWLETKQKRS